MHRILRLITWLVAGDQVLDLMDHHALGGSQAVRLGLRRRHPRQLTDCRVGSSPRASAAVVCGSLTSAHHSHPLAGRVRAGPQHALELLVHGGEAMQEVQLALLGSQQVKGLRVERGAEMWSITPSGWTLTQMSRDVRLAR